MLYLWFELTEQVVWSSGPSHLVQFVIAWVPGWWRSTVAAGRSWFLDYTPLWKKEGLFFLCLVHDFMLSLLHKSVERNSVVPAKHTYLQVGTHTHTHEQWCEFFYGGMCVFSQFILVGFSRKQVDWCLLCLLRVILDAVQSQADKVYPLCLLVFSMSKKPVKVKSPKKTSTGWVDSSWCQLFLECITDRILKPC